MPNRYDFLLVFRDPEEMSKSEDTPEAEASIFSPLTSLATVGATTLSVFTDESLSGERSRSSFIMGPVGLGARLNDCLQFTSALTSHRAHNPAPCADEEHMTPAQPRTVRR